MGSVNTAIPNTVFPASRVAPRTRHTSCPCVTAAHITDSEEKAMTGEPTNADDETNGIDVIGHAICDIDRLEARNSLVLQFRSYVYKIARELVKAVRTTLEVEDLDGWGSVGLLEAAARFDPSRGIKFRSFA